MRFVVITGPSGAGKTLALHSLEDAGYYTVDNLPPRLLPALVAFCKTEGYGRGAAVIDTRSGPAFDELAPVLDALKRTGEQVETLFLDAGDDILIHRYKETRRPHPQVSMNGESAAQGGIVEAVEAERALLETARSLADSILDTSDMSAVQLRDAIHTAYAQETRPGLRVTITSFGFKFGLPIDADLVFDVRFLRNPHYVPELKRLDGRDTQVAEYVHGDPLTGPFLDKMCDLIDFALPEYQREGKAYLTIAIGCTGGKHRSVTLAVDLAERLERAGHSVVVRHRDVGRSREIDALELELENRRLGNRGYSEAEHRPEEQKTTGAAASEIAVRPCATVNEKPGENGTC